PGPELSLIEVDAPYPFVADSPLDSSASQDKGVPGLPPAPDVAKLLRSPQDTMKPTRQSAKAKTPPTNPPKQVDGRSTRKPKLPLPPSEEVKRPAAAAAKKKTGTGELPHCRVATGLPFHNRIAYYFGMHDFGLYADDSLLKRWFCSEHVSFIKGHVDASVTDRLKDALKQVQEFFVAEEGHRTMLCKLVGASDDVSSPPPPQLHSFVDGARVVPESHQVVLALYRPSSNPTRKAMLDDGAADKAPYDVLTMHTTRFKPTDLDALNQIMNAANPQRPADEKHGLTPMLPFLSDQVDATEVQVPNEDIDAAVVQVLHNLVDAIAQYHAATSTFGVVILPCGDVHVLS
ncbi:hypothetical protein DYB30_012794, partial [Aphanomyces astaci]